MTHNFDLEARVAEWEETLSHCHYAGELTVLEETLPDIADAIRRCYSLISIPPYSKTGLLVLAINCMYYYHDESGFWTHFCQLLKYNNCEDTQARLGSVIER